MTGRRAAVLGSPISHSLSPVLHRAAYAELGLDWSYEAIEVTEPELAGFLDGLDETWAGLSLTMPLKRAVIPLLDELGESAATVRAVNTVVFAAGGRRIGQNTDVDGMVAALVDARLSRAAILGGGATAGSALAALDVLGATRIEMYVRSEARAAQATEIGARLGLEVTVAPWPQAARGLSADVVISTTPAGATDALANRVPDRPMLLFDVVYDPWPTRLASGWRAAGGAVIGGLDLLVEQAALQVKIMTGGHQPPIDAMRTAGLAALAARA